MSTDPEALVPSSNNLPTLPTAKDVPLIQSSTHNYDPYQCPADLDQALVHAKAKRIYRVKDNIQHTILKKETCPCCGFHKEGELIPLTADLSELYQLGSGYALYFKLTKYCIALLGLVLAISGIYSLVSNVSAGDCPESDDESDNSLCVQTFILKYSMANAKDHPETLKIQMILMLVSIIAIIIFTQFMRYQLRKVHIEVDDTTTTPADYTIKIYGLDPKLTDAEIKEWIEAVQTPENPIKCRRIHRTYKISEFVELDKKKHSLEVLKIHTQDDEKKKELQKEADKIDKELHELKEGGLELTDTILINFDKAHHAAYVIEKFKEGRLGNLIYHMKAFIGTSAHEFNGKTVFIERAPEPTDILWENLGHSPWEKFKMRSITKLWAAFIIIITFVVIVVINWAQTEASDDQEISDSTFAVDALSWAASLVVVIINFFLGMVIEKLADQERHGSFTSFFTGIAKKLVVSQIVNTAFTTLLAQVVLYNHFQQTKSLEGIDSVSFYGEGGLLEDMFYVFITNAILTPFLDFFDINYMIRLYKRYKAKKKGGRSKLTQQEANAIFEQPSVDIALNHSSLISTLLSTAFFIPALPSAMIIVIIGLAGNYWMDKYLLLRRNVHPISLQNELCETMLGSLEWMGAMMGFGNLLFILTLPNSEGVYVYNVIPRGLTYSILALGVFLALAPMKAINEKLFPIVDDVTEVHTYDAMKMNFPTTYKIQDPVTSKEGLQEHSESLKRKKVLIPRIRKNLRLGAHLLLTEKHFVDVLKSKPKIAKPDEVKIAPESEEQVESKASPKKLRLKNALLLSMNQAKQTADISASASFEEKNGKL